MLHIFASVYVANIGSDTGLSPIQCETIILGSYTLIGSSKGLLPIRFKPSSAPMLNYCHLGPECRLSPQKMKCRMQIGGRILSRSQCGNSVNVIVFAVRMRELKVRPRTIQLHYIRTYLFTLEDDTRPLRYFLFYEILQIGLCVHNSRDHHFGLTCQPMT